MLGFLKCGLPVSIIFLRQIFNFYLKLAEVIMTSSWQLPENESSRSSYGIWQFVNVIFRNTPILG
jgi:S-methylmethionine-dependent homocysteine/selenocysteine methylase